MVEEEMGSKYFESLYNQLSVIDDDAPWADQVRGQLQRHKVDVRFMKLFCLCLETWDWDLTSDEEISWETLITSFYVIWVEEEEEEASQSIGTRLFEIKEKDVQYFYPLAYELEGKIQQTRLKIEGCEDLLILPCKSSTIDEMLRFLGDLLQNLNDLLNYKAVKIVPFMNQIYALKEKLVFLCNSLETIATCSDGCSSQEFVDFTRVFANKAAGLTCLYWAKKEVNEQVAAETNLLLLDMMHKLKSRAPDVTACYFAIMNFNILRPSDPIRLREETVPGFVDLFFEHQKEEICGDFLILRDRLIFLFTFLTNPPPGDDAAKEDQGLIRSQIYALFHKDAYLLLPFNLIKDDFSNKKMLLSDFIIKIEIVNANIIQQLYHGFSASLLVLEEEKLNYMFFVPVQRELSLIEKHARWADDLVLGKLQLCRKEFTFLRMFLTFFRAWGDTHEQIRVELSSLITSLQGIWGKEEEEKGLIGARFHVMHREDMADWNLLTFELERKIQLSKQAIGDWLVSLLSWSFRSTPSTSNEILKFLDSILDNLMDLVNYKAGKIVPFIKQIDTLNEKLVLMQNLLKLTANCLDNEFGEFYLFVQAFAKNAACLTFLYLVKEANDETATETSILLSGMLLEIKPATPDVARLYFETLKAIYLQRSDSLLFGQAVSDFVDFFLEDLVVTLKDDFHILRDEIIFLLTFLNDPPNGKGEELICIQVDVLFSESVYGHLPFDVMKYDFSKKKVFLSDFMTKVEMLYATIRQHFFKFTDSDFYNFPKITAPRFLDSLIENIRNLLERMDSDRKCLSYAKYKIIRIERELVSLSPFYQHLLELQKEQKKLKDTWLQAVNVFHLTEHVINSCFVFNHSLWYHLACLSDVLDRIMVVKTMLEKIKGCNISNAMSLPTSAGIISTLTEQIWTSEIDDVVVGFEDDVVMITNTLIRGSQSLDIVSIVGMPGLGKTTLARKIYGSHEVKDHFTIRAFCSVSQVYNKRKILLDILRDVTIDVDKISEMDEDDLALQLKRRLSKGTYLIVLDDIWDKSAWDEVKSAFPDHNKGSRVMFTTRYHIVANECKIECSPHEPRALSDVESWELMKEKLSRNGVLTQSLSTIGQHIATKCYGLPLSVVVMSGILARIERSLSSWSKIEESVASYLSENGVTSILKLSYKHLPEYLRPCLLYLGAFPQNSVISVKKVMLLWIAEGFVQESITKSLEVVAREYIHDLVERSLILIVSRSSSGEIKTFRVHDVVRQFCQTKCTKKSFFGLGHGIAASISPDASTYCHYRVSMQNRNDITVDAEQSLPSTHSLLYFHRWADNLNCTLPLSMFKLTQVLHLGNALLKEFEEMSSLVHVRYLEATVGKHQSILSSMSNLWNMESLILYGRGKKYLPESLWRMKWLRHVKVELCMLKFSEIHEHEAYFRLDKVVSFSNPILSTGKDVEQLLQRLPAVRKLSCIVDRPLNCDKRVETLDFHRELDSLKVISRLVRCPYLINYPSTLKKLTLQGFKLPWEAISAIAEITCLQVLKLRWNSFPGPRWNMEDMQFPNLIFFELRDKDLVLWDASNDCFSCLKQLLIECSELEELPNCFEEVLTLKRVEIINSPELKSSAHRIQEELKQLGKKVDVLITSSVSED